MDRTPRIVGRLAVAHLRLARMYEQLAVLASRCGERDRAGSYARLADEHIREADVISNAGETRSRTDGDKPRPDYPD